ncbi:MAG: DUF2971 domain-containing protein [Gammaproteobacteria bacterium AqS3]|nr:DUF2971 domain-containing protein [Gammaproteobacteria bacterium AqS3]
MNTASKHKLSKFYKYMSAEVAKKVLSTNTLRWSSPLLFNDPFDVPRELAKDMNIANMLAASSKLIEEAVLNFEAEISYLAQDFYKLVLGLRRIKYPEKEKPLHEIREGQIFQKIDDYLLEDERQNWYEMLPKMRILCLSARKNIIPMWYHYADKYQDVVLELNPYTHINSERPWPMIFPVEYPDSFPELFTEKGWGKLLISSPENRLNELITFSTFIKKPDWRYEEEYRLVRLEETKSFQQYSDDVFSEKIISKIYFGPEIEPRNREYLIKLILERFPHVKAYDMNFKFGWETQLERIICSIYYLNDII